MAPLARTPPPPYYAVIFTSTRTPQESPEYRATDERLAELVALMPGFLGVEAVRDQAGVGITVSYWASEEAIRGWQRQAEHLVAQRLGREQWYERYELRVSRVERAYGFDRAAEPKPPETSVSSS